MANRTTAAAILGGACIVSAGLVFAGDLAPPAGPVAGTFKTLNDVEPRIPINNQTAPNTFQATHLIATPGSYYLTGDVTGEAGKTGILVATSNVTIDLNGYTLDGAGVGTIGVVAGGGLFGVTVRNGVVRNWTGHGIDIVSSDSSRIERVTSSFNDGWGMRGGENGVIIDCMAQGNGSYGFVVFQFSSIIGSNARENTLEGILTGGSVRVTNCVSTDNSIGFGIGSANTISNCTAYGNDGDGFVLGSGSVATNCSAYSSGDDGFSLGTGSSVKGCISNSSNSDGFVTGSGSSVIDCTAQSNGGHGVLCGANALVRGGIMFNNGFFLADGSGVLVNGADSRVEGVHAIRNNKYGVRATSGGSLVVACSASGNSVADIDAAVGINGPTLTVDPTDEAWGNFDY